MLETKSNWDVVAKKMHHTPSIQLGPYASYWMRKTPRRMLHSQSYYKFATKMIGSSKSVLDIGCNEGIGTFLLGRECGHALGIDFDKPAIASAQKNFSESFVSFEWQDFFSFRGEKPFDAITSFDVIEHIYPENTPRFFSQVCTHLKPLGIFVLGTPSAISQQFASEISKKGHINIYSHERLLEELKQYFHHVFLFSAHDELIHTGFYPLAHYFIALCTGKKSSTSSS